MRLYLLLLLSTVVLSSPARAEAPDGKPQRYSVAIAADATHAEVEADLWLSGDLLSLFNVVDVPGLGNGQASLLEAHHQLASLHAKLDRLLRILDCRRADTAEPQRCPADARCPDGRLDLAGPSDSNVLGDATALLDHHGLPKRRRERSLPRTPEDSVVRHVVHAVQQFTPHHLWRVPVDATDRHIRRGQLLLMAGRPSRPRQPWTRLDDFTGRRRGRPFAGPIVDAGLRLILRPPESQPRKGNKGKH